MPIKRRVLVVFLSTKQECHGGGTLAYQRKRCLSNEHIWSLHLTGRLELLGIQACEHDGIGTSGKTHINYEHDRVLTTVSIL